MKRTSPEEAPLWSAVARHRFGLRRLDADFLKGETDRVPRKRRQAAAGQSAVEPAHSKVSYGPWTQKQSCSGCGQ
jgi:hypothetical protein